MEAGGPEEACIRWGPEPPCEGAIIRGKDMPGHTRRHCAMSCIKLAEPIDLPFANALWTRMDRSKHKFNHIHLGTLAPPSRVGRVYSFPYLAHSASPIFRESPNVKASKMNIIREKVSVERIKQSASPPPRVKSTARITLYNITRRNILRVWTM